MSKSDTPPFLCVVEQHLHSSIPAVTRYQLREVRDTGYKVNQRWFDKFIRGAAGRAFFTDEQELWGYLRRWVEHKLVSARRAVDEYTELLKKLAAGDKTAVFVETTPDRQPAGGKPKPE